MNNILFISLFLLLFCSCKKEAKIKIPDVDPVPVVYSYISPTDTIIKLYLSMSVPLFKEASQTDIDVPDANVVLSSNQGSINLAYSSSRKCYCAFTSSFPIIAGETYKINVTLKNGLSVNAQTTVPNVSVNILSASVQDMMLNDTKYSKFRFNFIDQANTENYYRVLLHSIDLVENDTIVSGTGINNIYTDTGYDGVIIEADFDNYGVIDTTVKLGYDLYLLNINSDYYKYYKSATNYNSYDPFAEPIIIYSNIKGGLGVFAAYTMTKYRIKI